MFPYGSSLEPIERMNCTLHPFFLSLSRFVAENLSFEIYYIIFPKIKYIPRKEYLQMKEKKNLIELQNKCLKIWKKKRRTSLYHDILSLHKLKQFSLEEYFKRVPETLYIRERREILPRQTGKDLFPASSP